MLTMAIHRRIACVYFVALMLTAALRAEMLVPTSAPLTFVLPPWLGVTADLSVIVGLTSTSVPKIDENKKAAISGLATDSDLNLLQGRVATIEGKEAG